MKKSNIFKGWRLAGCIAGTFLILLGLLTYKLGSLQGNSAAGAEISAYNTTPSLGAIAHDPTYAPYKLVQYIISSLLPASTMTLRITSVLFAISAVFMMIYVLRRWYGVRTAILGAIIFAASSWFLHIGRLATFDVMYLWAVPALLVANIVLHTYTEQKRAVYGWLVVMEVLLYIPGLIWLVLLNAWLQRKEIAEGFQTLGSYPRKALWCLLGLVLLVPLGYGVYQNPNLTYGLNWLGLPRLLPDWIEPLKHSIASLLFVSIKSPADPVRWLGRLPALDVFTSAMLIGGIAFYARHWRAGRTRLIIGYELIGFLLVAAGGPVSRSILIPLLYLLAAGGIAYILHGWLQVFPRNVLARRLAIALVSVAVITSCGYNLRSYFIAWSHNAATHQAFQVDYPKPPAALTE